MMQTYVVFKCPKCGKGTYNCVRNQNTIVSRSYACYRCGHTSSYRKITIRGLKDNVNDAVNAARQADLGEQISLTPEERKQLITIGEQFMDYETYKKQTERESAEKVNKNGNKTR